MTEPLYINDIALINALGSNKEEIASRLFAGDRSGMVLNSELLATGDIHVAAVAAELPDLTDFATHYRSRNNQLAMLALQQLAPTLKDLKAAIPKQRIGVILGTSTSGIAQGEEAMRCHLSHQQWPQEYDYRLQEIANLSEFVAQAAEVSGIALTISTACSSSAKSFITAHELIAAGVIDAAIVGGVDTLCGMTINGFNALESTSAGLCNPSSRNRDGINIGEAAALAIVSRTPAAVVLSGFGESSDAHHMSAPHPQGEGAIASMTEALAQAKLSPEQIDYINLHGTATPKNDEMEAIAVHKVFGADLPVSSTKAMLGHTLGAAGATEVGICCLVLEHQQLAPHIWDEVVDPALPSLHFVGVDERAEINYCLTNSFAFGGNNVSLIIGKNTE